MQDQKTYSLDELEAAARKAQLKLEDAYAGDKSHRLREMQTHIDYLVHVKIAQTDKTAQAIVKTLIDYLHAPLPPPPDPADAEAVAQYKPALIMRERDLCATQLATALSLGSQLQIAKGDYARIARQPAENSKDSSVIATSGTWTSR